MAMLKLKCVSALLTVQLLAAALVHQLQHGIMTGCYKDPLRLLKEELEQTLEMSLLISFLIHVGLTPQECQPVQRTESANIA
jgi:hypothetical protein